MPRKKGKTISFDAMVKFFMQNYDIPTKKDVDKLMARLDRLETLVKQSALGANNARPQYSRRKTALTAVDIVLLRTGYGLCGNTGQNRFRWKKNSEYNIPVE